MTTPIAQSKHYSLPNSTLLHEHGSAFAVLSKRETRRPRSRCVERNSPSQHACCLRLCATCTTCQKESLAQSGLTTGFCTTWMTMSSRGCMSHMFINPCCASGRTLKASHVIMRMLDEANAVPRPKVYYRCGWHACSIPFSSLHRLCCCWHSTTGLQCYSCSKRVMPK